MNKLFALFFLAYALTLSNLSFAEGVYVYYGLDNVSTTKIPESRENLNRRYDYDHVYKDKNYHADFSYNTKSDPGKAFTFAAGYDFDDFMIQGSYSKGHIVGKTNFEANASKYTYSDHITHKVDYTMYSISVIGKVKLSDNFDLEPEIGIAKVCYHLLSDFTIKEYKINLYEKSGCGKLPKVALGLSYKLTKNSKLVASVAAFGHPNKLEKRAVVTSIGIRTTF